MHSHGEQNFPQQQEDTEKSVIDKVHRLASSSGTRAHFAQRDTHTTLLAETIGVGVCVCVSLCFVFYIRVCDKFSLDCKIKPAREISQSLKVSGMTVK